jgi:hypothetical protein
MIPTKFQIPTYSKYMFGARVFTSLIPTYLHFFLNISVFFSIPNTLLYLVDWGWGLVGLGDTRDSPNTIEYYPTNPHKHSNATLWFP